MPPKKKASPSHAIQESIREPELVRLRLDAILPWGGNPREHDAEQLRLLGKSLERYGLVALPVVQAGTNKLIAGHGRLMALKGRLAPDAEVPVLAVHLSDQDAVGYAVADNRLTDLSTWNIPALRSAIAEIDDGAFDIEATGFTQDALDELFPVDESDFSADSSKDPDAVPAAPKNPVTRKGDLWKLGQHRLLCGDCRDSGDVAMLFDGVRINVAITSPPYASQREYDPGSGFKPIRPDEYAAWYKSVADNIKANIEADGSYFCNIKEHCEGGQRSLYVKDLVIAHAREWGWRYVDEFCWRNTRNGVPGVWPNRFKNAWEPVFHFAEGVPKERPDALADEESASFVDGWEPVFHYSQDTQIKFNPDAVSTKSNAVFKYKKDNAESKSGSGLMGTIVGKTTGKARPSNVVETAAESAVGEHSAPYPVALPRFFILAFSDRGDVVFDPFMGSGTTLIAAHATGRVGYGTEISPTYCDVIVRRWEGVSGQKAVLVRDGEEFPGALDRGE